MYRGEPGGVKNNVLFADGTKINLYQSDGKVEVWRKEVTSKILLQNLTILPFSPPKRS